ncbi:MAG: serine/threonine protein phosphatase [Planctomycetes bacterium]|nr:serine/threonine protein phosphatase [Planctomycetota bacterium]
MNSKNYFEKLRREAEQKGYLSATPDGLNALDKWLKESKGLTNKKAREYQTERIHLLDSQGSKKPYTTRLLEYLNAYGTRLIKASTTAEKSEKEAHLENLLTSIRDASQKSLLSISIPLYTLLDNDLSKHSPTSSDIVDPNKIVDEQSLADVAPENCILKLKKAAKVYVIGDIHGDASTAKLIANWLSDKLKNANAVFLGDYVNNGLQSIGVLEEVLRLKQKFSKSVILLSGNHEFGETYATALTEFFSTHWDQWLELSASLTPEWKAPPGHYGHVRLDLVVRYGAEVGEAVHRKFELWGRSLPLCVLYRDVFMCHSIGLCKSQHAGLSRNALESAKKNLSDIKKLVFDGYEAWKEDCENLHASMVNNREITADTINTLKENVNANLFLVGHTHYRSGDRDVIGGGVLQRAAKKKSGCIATICSSYPRSKDAGHYIAREFEWKRRKIFEETEPSRDCSATSCVVVLEDSTTKLLPEHLLPLYRMKHGQ